MIARVIAAVGAALAIWMQFENTALHDRLIDKQAGKETALEIQGEQCGIAMTRLARLIVECSESCGGE